MEKYKKLLSEFVALKSISTDPSYGGEIDKALEWLNKKFSERGFETKNLESSVNPVFFAERIIDPSLETVMIYGHYDVQPAENKGWFDDPFKLIEKDGKLIARGSIDNKGQILVHILTVFDLLEKGELGYNVKFLIEGNEETGSQGVAGVTRKNEELLKSDFVLVSDGPMPYRPLIEIMLRGIINLKVRYKTSDTNLHSGIFGGAVPSASVEIARLISKVFGENHKILVDNFEKNVREISEEDERIIEQWNEFEDGFKRNSGTKKLFIDGSRGFKEKTGFGPTIEVTGLKSGYIGDGFSSIIPGVAEAKFSFRIVADQNPDKVIENFERFVLRNTPDYVDVELEKEEGVSPVRIELGSKNIQKAKKVLQEVFGMEVMYEAVGGTIGAFVHFQNILNVDIISIPLAGEDCKMHGTNENFDIGLLEKGLEFSRKFLSKNSR